MIPVIETGQDEFSRVSGAATLERLDGEGRVPLETMLGEGWTDADRAAFGLFLADPAPPVPAGQMVAASRFERDGDRIVEIHDLVPAPAPTLVSPRQMKLALLGADRLDAIEAFVAQAPRAVQISWEYAVEFRRDDPMIAAGAAELGWTEAEIDGLFAAAATL